MTFEDLQRTAYSQGWRIEHGRKHLKWYPPDHARRVVITSLTPSDRRAVNNIQADLRRSGLVV